MVSGVSNVLRLRQPRSAVSKMIWATRPKATEDTILRSESLAQFRAQDGGGGGN
jgi:hypothetical protein